VLGFVIGIFYIAIENQKNQIIIIENQNTIIVKSNIIIENQSEIISLQSSMSKSVLRNEMELHTISAMTVEFYGFPADQKYKVDK